MITSPSNLRTIRKNGENITLLDNDLGSILVLEINTEIEPKCYTNPGNRSGDLLMVSYPQNSWPGFFQNDIISVCMYFCHSHGNRFKQS